MIRMNLRIFPLIMVIISLPLQAQTPIKESDQSICTTASSLYRSGNELIASITIVVTRNLSTNESIVLVPSVGNSQTNRQELPPIYINSRKQQVMFNREINKKEKNAQILQRKNDTRQTVHYLQSIPFEKWMNHAILSLTERNCGCGIVGKEAFTCIASMTPQPAFTPHLVFLVPNMEESKIRNEQGSAFIDFPINDTVIHQTFSNNTSELNKIKQTIDIIKNDTNTNIKHIIIHGYASPDGPFKLNERLSRERTEALKKHVRQLYKFDPSLIETSYTAEDWEGFEAFLSDTICAEKAEWLKIVESDMHPDQKEAKLKKQFPSLYQFILANWFPLLRHSDYTVQYYVRPFNLEESRKVFETNPKNLSIEEMFRLSLSYTPGSETYNKIFMTAALLYPDDPVANLNAACIALAQKDIKTGEYYLKKAPDVPQKILAKGVVLALQYKFEEAEKMFEQAKAAGLTQADENLKQISELK